MLLVYSYGYLLLIFVAVLCTIINDFCGMHLLSSFFNTTMHREFTRCSTYCMYFVCGCTELSFYSCIVLVLHVFYVMCKQVHK